MSFDRSIYTNKYKETEMFTRTVKNALKSSKLFVSEDKSHISASRYLYVKKDEDEDTVKIRISDHDARVNDSDFYAFVGDCPSRIIYKVHSHFGMDVPAFYSAAAFETRRARAEKAALTAKEAKMEIEETMIRTIADSIKDHKTASIVAARSAYDSIYANEPSNAARRRRVCEGAARDERNRREAIAAGDDVIKLKSISICNDYAKERLTMLLAQNEKHGHAAAIRP